MRLPSLLAAVLLVGSLAGCSLFGDDYSDLEPGTFRLSADGREYSGSASYEPRTEFQFDQATVFLVSGGTTVLQISQDAFLTAQAGDHFEPLAFFQGNYQHRSGDVEIVSVTPTSIEGRFRFRMRETGNGPVRGSDITAAGGFHALLADE